MKYPCARDVYLPLIWLVFVAVSAFLPVPASARSTVDPAEACDAAAQRASTQTGVPLDVLRAITRTETGRGKAATLEPWPWTVNMEGAGVWFDTEDEAQVYVFRHFKRGARSFDVGCFQVNYKWHGAAFDSINQMFDPDENALYAAGFLKKLHAELGDWQKAAGAYHSRTQKYAARYLARYEIIRASLPDPAPPQQRAVARTNGFPLLRATNGNATRGSLVPLGSGGGVSLFSPASGG